MSVYIIMLLSCLMIDWRNVLKQNRQYLHRTYFRVTLLTESGLTSKTNLCHLTYVADINTERNNLVPAKGHQYYMDGRRCGWLGGK